MDNVALAALSSKETVYASYDIARLAIERGIPGDFVECGVFGGAQCAAMARAIMEPIRYYRENRETAKALNELWPPRRVHLFDSFAGIPQAGPEDREFIEAGHEPGLSVCTLEAVKDHLKEWGIPDELLVYHPGLFEETTEDPMLRAAEILEVSRSRLTELPELPERIAVLRLDGDLYDSTRVCLENLYPLVSPGGWVICDDWDLSGARKAVLEHIGRNFGPVMWQKKGS
jgi:hypothetical protein